MAKFCTNCGKELINGAMFCSECGTKVEENESVNEKTVLTPEIVQTTFNTTNQSNNNTSYNKDNQNPSEVVGTGYFFGMMMLYSIPVIGWIICLITIFTSENKNKKNFAKAKLIWIIIEFFLFMGIYSLICFVVSLVQK